MFVNNSALDSCKKYATEVCLFVYSRCIGRSVDCEMAKTRLDDIVVIKILDDVVAKKKTINKTNNLPQ